MRKSRVILRKYLTWHCSWLILRAPAKVRTHPLSCRIISTLYHIILILYVNSFTVSLSNPLTLSNILLHFPPFALAVFESEVHDLRVCLKSADRELKELKEERIEDSNSHNSKVMGYVQKVWTMENPSIRGGHISARRVL